eukprot:m.356193 g.356193  ORF g.356193 m.356193 type:complete len:531 (+) comp17469_c0_seq1:200-1792(+)
MALSTSSKALFVFAMLGCVAAVVVATAGDQTTGFVSADLAKQYLPTVVGAVVVLYLVQALFSGPKTNAVPMCGGLPLLQHSLLVQQNEYRLLDWMQAGAILSGYKSFFFKILGCTPHICISSPENVKHLLKDNFDNYVKGDYFYDRMSDLLGTGIFNSDGDQWLYQRKTASHLFKRNELRGYMMEVFNEHAKQACDFMEAKTLGVPFDIQDVFYRYTLESIGRVAYGARIGAFDAEVVAFAKNFDEAQWIVSQRMLDPLWQVTRWLKPFLPRERRLAKCVAALDEFAMKVIEERREVGDLADREDLLSRFMALKDVDGKPLGNDRLRDVIMSFVIAGRDTTANLLSWIVYELHKHPDVADKLRQHVDDELKGAEPSHDVIHYGMPYLNAVVKETLRLHPSVPKDVKVALNDDVLPDGTKIPAGANVVYMPWVMGRMESLWPNATEFKPERWLDMEEEPSQYKFTAFNAGPRICLGMNMAYLEAKVMVATLFQRYIIHVEEDQSFDYLSTLTMPIKDDLRVYLEPRDGVRM